VIGAPAYIWIAYVFDMPSGKSEGREQSRSGHALSAIEHRTFLTPRPGWSRSGRSFSASLHRQTRACDPSCPLCALGVSAASDPECAREPGAGTVFRFTLPVAGD